MTYITLEEAFAVPGMDHPPLPIRLTPGRGEELRHRLHEFTGDRLSEMDKYGIDIQVLSLGVPGIQGYLESGDAVENAIKVNDFLAGVIADNPTRFRGFASLPMQDPTAAIAELRRSVDELGFVGAMINGHTHGHYLDEPQYDEFWGAVEATGLPIYLHPSTIESESWNLMKGHRAMYGGFTWAAETGGHALRLLYGGVFDRHPDARLILGHMGEFLPFMRSRLDSRYLTVIHDNPLERMPSEYIGTNIVLTNSGVFDPAVLAAAVECVGADAIMFSVDYPYEETAEAIEGFEKTRLNDVDRAKIAHENARRILKL